MAMYYSEQRAAEAQETEMAEAATPWTLPAVNAGDHADVEVNP
jgi:hypothetical protein